MNTPHATASGLTEEQAEKRRPYQEALDRFAGFEPYESSLPDEPILARRAARVVRNNPAGFLSGEGQPLLNQTIPSFEAIQAGILARPGMIEHLDGIDLDGDGIPDAPSGPPPFDPVMRMQWEKDMAMHQQNILANRMRKSHRHQIYNQVLLAQLKAWDPLFQMVHSKVLTYVQELHLRVRRPFLAAVEQTPGAYLDLYKEMRDVVLLSMCRARSTERFARLVPKDTWRDTTLSSMGAPFWESGDLNDAHASVASRDAERVELVKRIRSGGAREGDLVRYMELCDM